MAGKTLVRLGPAGTRYLIACCAPEVFRRFNDLHSAPVELLLRFGIAGLALAVAVGVTAVTPALRALRTRRLPPDVFLLVMAVLSLHGLLALVNFRMLNYDWRFFGSCTAASPPRLLSSGRMIVKLKRLINRLRYGREAERKRKRAEKEKRRQQKFHSERWYRDERLARRHYDSYEDCVRHQSAKLERVLHRLKETEADDFREFQRRFSLCDALKPARSVLCLGPRLGTEVKALHSLGYFAVGIDLNPGHDNPYVLPGDFHALVFADASVDAVYTNAFDHAFEPERVLAEVVRVLRPGGGRHGSAGRLPGRIHPRRV